MKRSLITFLLTIACFIFQSTVFARYSIGGIIPNFMIVITASYGFMYGEKYGMCIGFFCGLLTDIFFGNLIGIYSLIYLYIGYLNGKFNNIFYPEDIKLPMALIVGSDFVYGFICYMLFFLLRGKFDVLFYMSNVILPEVVYTIVITIFLYPLILRLNKKILGEEKRSTRNFV